MRRTDGIGKIIQGEVYPRDYLMSRLHDCRSVGVPCYAL